MKMQVRNPGKNVSAHSVSLRLLMFIYTVTCLSKGIKYWKGNQHILLKNAKATDGKPDVL
jgi:hypothetical protein